MSYAYTEYELVEQNKREQNKREQNKREHGVRQTERLKPNRSQYNTLSPHSFSFL